MTEKDQKFLNRLFWAVSVFCVISFLIYLKSPSTRLIMAQLIVFPILAYLVKMGNKFSSVLLLILFTLGKIQPMLNSTVYLKSPLTLLSLVFWLFFVLVNVQIWIYFYKAYLILKNKDRRKD